MKPMMDFLIKATNRMHAQYWDLCNENWREEEIYRRAGRLRIANGVWA